MPLRSAIGISEPVTIFHLVSSLDVGGTQMGMLQTILGLNPSKFRSVVCSIMPPGRIAAAMECRGIRTYSLGVTSPWDLRALPRLLSLIKAERPQILHSYLFHANLLARFVGKVSGVPAIINSERSVDQLGRCRILLSRMTLALATIIETNSEACRQYVHSTLGVDLGKVQVIYSGVELTQQRAGNGQFIRSELGLYPEIPLIGFVGRLYPVKGAEYTVQAFARVVEQLPRAHLIVLGDGPERQQLEGLANSLGLEQNIRFLGDREDVPDIMAAIDVLAISSLTESLPRVALEAMAASKPVVATRVGGVPEVVVDGVTGLITEPGDTVALAQSLLKVLSDPSLARQMGNAGRERVEKMFSATASISRFEELYRMVLTGGRQEAVRV